MPPNGPRDGSPRDRFVDARQADPNPLNEERNASGPASREVPPTNAGTNALATPTDYGG